MRSNYARMKLVAAVLNNKTKQEKKFNNVVRRARFPYNFKTCTGYFKSLTERRRGEMNKRLIKAVADPDLELRGRGGRFF